MYIKATLHIRQVEGDSFGGKRINKYTWCTLLKY